jgi:hypothetical protein
MGRLAPKIVWNARWRGLLDAVLPALPAEVWLDRRTSDFFRRMGRVAECVLTHEALRAFAAALPRGGCRIIAETLDAGLRVQPAWRAGFLEGLREAALRDGEALRVLAAMERASAAPAG